MRFNGLGKSVLRVVILTYLGLCGLMWVGQRTLLYFPTVLTVEGEMKEARSFGWEPWRNPTGGTWGWIAQRPQAVEQPRWVLFHGNGSLSLHQERIVQLLRQNPETHTHGIYLVEYPGYASQPGKPTEKTIMDQALSAVAALGREQRAPIFLLGESLGTGVACAVAGAQPEAITGLLLMMPFNRLADVAGAHYPWVPVPLILRDRFDSAAQLKKFHGPLALVLGERDRVIPPALSRRLYHNYEGKKWMRALPDAGHDVLWPGQEKLWWGDATRFLLNP